MFLKDSGVSCCLYKLKKFIKSLHMDLFETLEDELDEFFDTVTRAKRPKVINVRPDYMEKFDEKDFRLRFRLTKNAVEYLYGLIKEDIDTSTSWNMAISGMQRLLLTLRYYATGSFLITAADFSGISKASAGKIIFSVSHAIAKLRPMYIKFPNDLAQLNKFFYEIAKFPKLIGAIDCTHIVIKSPGGENAEVYRNRKSRFSINVQCVCSAELKILDIVARWPGSSHDQTIFDNSKLKQRLIDGEFGHNIIVGDSGYENNNYIVTPLQNPTTPAEQLYNESQIRSRNVVERAFGVLKSRFPVLRLGINLYLPRAQLVIVACAVLHNIAIEMNEDQFEISEEDEEEDSDFFILLLQKMLEIY